MAEERSKSRQSGDFKLRHIEVAWFLMTFGWKKENLNLKSVKKAFKHISTYYLFR